MKKSILPLLLCVCLALGGCANKNEARFREFSEAMRERSDLEVTAEVRAEYDGQSCSFTLKSASPGVSPF